MKRWKLFLFLVFSVGIFATANSTQTHLVRSISSFCSCKTKMYNQVELTKVQYNTKDDEALLRTQLMIFSGVDAQSTCLSALEVHQSCMPN